MCAAFAKEGADVAIAYLSEDEDARHTAGLVDAEGCGALTLPGDLQEESRCQEVVERTAAELGRLDVLVNHMGTQTPVESPEEITTSLRAGRSSTPARSTACAATSRSSTTRPPRAPSTS